MASSDESDVPLTKNQNINGDLFVTMSKKLPWGKPTLIAVALNIVIQIAILSWAFSSNSPLDFMGVNWNNFFTPIITISNIMFSLCGLFGILNESIIIIQFYFIAVITNCVLHIGTMITFQKYFYFALSDMVSQVFVIICVNKVLKHLKSGETLHNPQKRKIKSKYVECMKKNRYCNALVVTLSVLGAKTVGTIAFIVLIMNAPVVNWVASFGAYFELIFDFIGLYGIHNAISQFIIACFVYNVFVIILHLSPLIMEESALSLSVAAIVAAFELFVALIVWRAYALLRKVHFQQILLLPK